MNTTKHSRIRDFPWEVLGMIITVAVFWICVLVLLEVFVNR